MNGTRRDNEAFFRATTFFFATVVIVFIPAFAKAQITGVTQETHCACVTISDAKPDCNPSTEAFAIYEHPTGASDTQKAALYKTASEAACTKLNSASRTCTHIPQADYALSQGTYTNAQMKTWCEQAAAGLSVKAESEFKLPSDIATLNKLGTTSVPILIGRFLKMLMGIVGSIALAVLVYGGFLWMTSMGNADHVGKAKNLLIWGALGVLVILSSYAIVSFLFDVF
jgi:hypothetical protein